MARGARTGKPAPIRDPIKISTAIAIKNVKTGLSKAATAINNMTQIGTLLTPSPPVDTDLALSSTQTVSNPSDPSPWRSGSYDRFVVLWLASRLRRYRPARAGSCSHHNRARLLAARSSSDSAPWSTAVVIALPNMECALMGPACEP